MIMKDQREMCSAEKSRSGEVAQKTKYIYESCMLVPPYGVLCDDLQFAAVSCGFNGCCEISTPTEDRLFRIKVLIIGILKHCYVRSRLSRVGL